MSTTDSPPARIETAASAEPSPAGERPANDRRAQLLTAAALALLVALAALYFVRYAAQVQRPLILPDELQWFRLSLNLPHELLPTLHGKPFPSYNPLYPLLIAPAGLLRDAVPEAFMVAKALNTIVMASVAVPTYLLVRAVGAGRGAALLGAAIVAAGPWLAFTSLLMTENAAYPAFVWAMWGIHRALVRPGGRSTAIALTTCALAFAARTQFIVLFAVLVAAAIARPVMHELARSQASWRTRARAGLRTAWQEQRSLLVIAGSAFALTALAVAARGADAALGAYDTVFERSILPPGLLRQSLMYTAALTVGAGFLPLVATLAVTASQLRRPTGRAVHAFAVLVALTVPALLYQASSFSINFDAGTLQDRYVFYLVPLLVVGLFAAAFALRTRWAPLGAGAVIAVLVIPSGFFGGYGATQWLGSPSSALAPVWNGRLSQLNAAFGTGVSIELALAAAAVLAGALLALATRRPGTRTATLVLAAPVLVWTLGATQYQQTHQATWSGALAPADVLSADVLLDERRNWVDAATAPGTSVMLLKTAAVEQGVWWQDEFWNRRVDKLGAVANPSQSPRHRQDQFHLSLLTLNHDRVGFDRRTGAVTGIPRNRQVEHVVVGLSESRFGLAGAREVTRVDTRRLQRVPRPWRAAWLGSGLQDDGWTSARGATIRVFGTSRSPQRRTVTVSVVNNRDARDARAVQRVALAGAPGGERVIRPGRTGTLRTTVCVPAGGPADVRLAVRGSSTLPDGRVVGTLVSRVDVDSAGPRCRP